MTPIRKREGAASRRHLVQKADILLSKRITSMRGAAKGRSCSWLFYWIGPRLSTAQTLAKLSISTEKQY
jgi:hypothetical protein